MAITSVGYAGTVTDADWRRLATAAVGALYGVDDYASWKVTPGVGDRAVQIAAGGGFGLGVRDASDTVVTKTLATVGSGSRWDLIVAHRDWATKVTTFEVIQGTATKALPPRDTGFGNTNDQPIALARVAAGQTAVQDVVDLRCIPGDGGVVAFDDLARSYLDRLGTVLRIGNTLWSRTVDSLGNPIWIEVGSKAFGHIGMMGAGNGTYLPLGSAGLQIPMSAPAPSDLGGGMTAEANGLRVPRTTRYRITVGAYFTGTTDRVCLVVVRNNGAEGFKRVVLRDASGYFDEARTFSIQRTLTAGDLITLTASGAYAWGKSGYDGFYLEVEEI